MLILSKFHDYYDSILKQVGVDKTIVYERKPGVLGVHVPFESIATGLNWRNRDWDIEQSLGGIVFCGKLYPFLYTEKDKKISYDMDEIKTFVADNDWRHQKMDYLNENMRRDYTDFHRKANSPILSLDFLGDPNSYLGLDYRKGAVFTNPCLSLFSFYKVKHPVQAFQELMMYISGVLGTPEKEAPKMSDKQKVQSHGYNKWSFRKDTPPTRKR